MDKYIFSRWEAIDLFVKIIAKYENKDKQIVENDLTAYLGKFKRAEASTLVAKKTLMPIADDRFGSQNYYPKFLTDLSNEILDGVPMVRPMKRVYLMLEYIGESSQINGYELSNSGKYKTESLEGSHWWLYSHEIYSSEKTEKKKMVITRDPVSLNPFSYAALTTTKTHNGEFVSLQNYSGHYYIKNNKYLFLDLRVSKTKDKELRVVVDIGSGNVNIGDVFTGYYLNGSNNLYFGPVLFERISKDDNLQVDIFKDGDPKLDIAVRHFFSGMDTIPCKVIPSFGAKGQIGAFLEK